jgi:putative phosphoesterase
MLIPIEGSIYLSRRLKMKLAVMSDSHDNVWKLRQAFPLLKTADAVLHCGDLSAPFMIRELGEHLPGIPIHLVWGNNDGDRYLISQVAQSYPDVHLHGELAELELDGLSVAVNHYPRIAQALAHSKLYDLVCYGHDHKAHESWIGECLLLNPGELMGLKAASSFAFVDSERRTVEMITL